MEKNQALAVAAGVGALGTLVGYLGYSYLNINQTVLENETEEEPLTVEKEEKLTSMWTKFWANQYNDINKEEEEEEETTEKETTEKETTENNLVVND